MRSPDRRLTIRDVRRELQAVYDQHGTQRALQDPRGRVLARPTTKKLGFALGLSSTRRREENITPLTRKLTEEFPDLVWTLCWYMRQRKPDFFFTSIYVNVGPSALHVDIGNCNKSAIMALGEFTGGRLWIMTPEGHGKVLDVRNKIQIMDGGFPHVTEKTCGLRFSIVWYTLRASRRILVAKVARELRSYGFPSLRRRPKSCAPSHKELLGEARKQIRVLPKWGLCTAFKSAGKAR